MLLLSLGLGKETDLCPTKKNGSLVSMVLALFSGIITKKNESEGREKAVVNKIPGSGRERSSGFPLDNIALLFQRNFSSN